MIVHVKLTPRSGADQVDGWGKDPAGRPVLKARVRARPVEGEANAALEKLLARALGLSASRVRIARGGQSRLKAVEVSDLDEADLFRILGAPEV